MLIVSVTFFAMVLCFQLRMFSFFLILCFLFLCFYVIISVINVENVTRNLRPKFVRCLPALHWYFSSSQGFIVQFLFPSSMSNLVTLISCQSMILLTMFSFLSIVKNVLPLTSFPIYLTFQATHAPCIPSRLQKHNCSFHVSVSLHDLCSI